MSSFTEKARKLAGISQMATGSYPLDSKQRGCQFWGKFVVAVDTLYEELREERDRLRDEVKESTKDVMKSSKENGKLREQLAQTRLNVATREIRDEVPEFTPGHQSRLLESVGK